MSRSRVLFRLWQRSLVNPQLQDEDLYDLQRVMFESGRGDFLLSQWITQTLVFAYRNCDSRRDDPREFVSERVRHAERIIFANASRDLKTGGADHRVIIEETLKVACKWAGYQDLERDEQGEIGKEKDSDEQERYRAGVDETSGSRVFHE